MAERASSTQGLNVHIAFSSLFLVLALAGWGGFAYSERTAAERQADLAASLQRIRTEQETLRAERDRLLSEHRARAAEAAEVDYLRNRVAALEADGRVLGEEREQARAGLAAARQELAALQERLEQAEAEPPSATGATRSARRRGLRGERSRSR